MAHRIFKKIKQKNRLNEYENILLYAIEHNYKLISLFEWYKYYKDSKCKVLILRHDVDYDTKGAYTFFQIEKEMGAHSTFYFRWSSMNNKIMREMHKNNFEVSLHYETLSKFSIKNKIFNKENIDNQVISICRQLLSDEILQFEKKYWKIHTICSHGDLRNRILGLPNHIIWDKSQNEKYRILFETYDKFITEKFDAYISDSSIYKDFEWQHFGSPYNAINEKKQTICLLTHPIHWNQSLLKNLQMLLKVYFDSIPYTRM